MRLRSWVAALAATACLAACSLPATSPTGGASKTATNSAASTLKQHVQPDWDADGKTIKPTAIVLHWWGGWGGGHNIDRLVRDANANSSNYDPKKKSTDDRPIVGHVTVQIGITGDGKAYQLTPKLNTFARHAKCANQWAVGIEIEGNGPGSEHYIGDNKTQFNSVVTVVRQLMRIYGIKPVSVVADDGRSGRGIVSHKMVDATCRWADGKHAGEGKDDVDDAYLKSVLKSVGG